MDELIKKAIEKELIRKTQTGFTDEVMKTIFELKKSKEYKPIISKTGWGIIAIVALFIIVMLFSIQPKMAEGEAQLAFMKNAIDFVNTIKFGEIDVFEGVNLLLVAVVSLAIFLLLFFDSIFIRKHSQTNAKIV